MLQHKGVESNTPPGRGFFWAMRWKKNMWYKRTKGSTAESSRATCGEELGRKHQMCSAPAPAGKRSLSARSAQPVAAHTAVQMPLSGALRGERGGQPAPAPVLLPAQPLETLPYPTYTLGESRELCKSEVQGGALRNQTHHV